MQLCDWCAKQSWCSAIYRYKCIMQDHLYYTPETPAEERAGNYPMPPHKSILNFGGSDGKRTRTGTKTAKG